MNYPLDFPIYQLMLFCSLLSQNWSSLDSHTDCLVQEDTFALYASFIQRLFRCCIRICCNFTLLQAPSTSGSRSPCFWMIVTHQPIVLCLQWKLGCLIFSLGVSIKMNVLLFAPGLLLLLLKNTGVKKTTICLSICAAVQLALGSPFLLSHPISYISKAFELSRVFLYVFLLYVSDFRRLITAAELVQI